MPASTDTPFFQHSANYTGKAVKTSGPVSDPETVAKKIADLVEHPKREVYVGAAQWLRLQHAVMPALTEKQMAKMAKGHLSTYSAPEHSGALYAPEHDGRTVSGGWKDEPEEAIKEQ